MKIEVKYNIDFGKALKILNEQNLDKYINADLADKTAKLARDYITDGKVKPKLSDNNPRKKKDPNARPLFDTGNLANSLKGSSRGITANKPTDSGIPYRSHRESDFTWRKPDGHPVKVPQREFIVAKSRGKLLLRGTSGLVDKIYKEFEKKFTNLLSKRIRKR